MKVPLRDGQWAELRERINHGGDKAIRRARVRTRENPGEHAADDFTVLLQVFISAWNVLDLDGKPIDLADADAIDRCPSDITNELIGEALPLYFPATVPNASTPESSDDSP